MVPAGRGARGAGDLRARGARLRRPAALGGAPARGRGGRRGPRLPPPPRPGARAGTADGAGVRRRRGAHAGRAAGGAAGRRAGRRPQPARAVPHRGVPLPRAAGRTGGALPGVPRGPGDRGRLPRRARRARGADGERTGARPLGPGAHGLEAAGRGPAVGRGDGGRGDAGPARRPDGDDLRLGQSCAPGDRRRALLRPGGGTARGARGGRVRRAAAGAGRRPRRPGHPRGRGRRPERVGTGAGRVGGRQRAADVRVVGGRGRPLPDRRAACRSDHRFHAAAGGRRAAGGGLRAGARGHPGDVRGLTRAWRVVSGCGRRCRGSGPGCCPGRR